MDLSEVWAQAPVKLELSDHKSAVKLRLKLNSWRFRERKAYRELYGPEVTYPLDKFEIRMSNEGPKWFLNICEPQPIEFKVVS